MFEPKPLRCYYCAEYLTVKEAERTTCPHCKQPYSKSSPATKQDLKELKDREKKESARKAKRRYKVISSSPDSGLTEPWEWDF